jgi:hypothetical protein
MAEIPKNPDFEYSKSNLPNSSNKWSEWPWDIDIRRRFMKMGSDIDSIVYDWRISDLWGDRLIAVQWITTTIEENLALVMNILNLTYKGQNNLR